MCTQYVDNSKQTFGIQYVNMFQSCIKQVQNCFKTVSHKYYTSLKHVSPSFKTVSAPSQNRFNNSFKLPLFRVRCCDNQAENLFSITEFELMRNTALAYAHKPKINRMSQTRWGPHSLFLVGGSGGGGNY